MIFFISFDPTTGRGNGGGASPDGTLPTGFTICTQAQAQEPGLWQLVNGAIVAAPPLPPTPAQQAATSYNAFIAAGLAVTSTGTPSLNGTYQIDAATQVNIATEAQFISSFGEFTNGTTTDLEWPTAAGFVVFPTPTEFLAFAKQAGQAVAAAKLASSKIAAGQTAAMPSAAITLP